jgi:hypothetical protein
MRWVNAFFSKDYQPPKDNRELAIVDDIDTLKPLTKQNFDLPLLSSGG